MRELGPKGLVAVDAAAAAVVVALAVVRAPQVDLVACVLAVLVGAPLAVRRLRPVAVLVVVVVAGMAAIVLGPGNEVVLVAVALALYPVGLSSARTGALGAAGALAGVVAAGLTALVVPGPAQDGVESFRTTPGSALASSAVVVVAAWAVAAAVRVRRRHEAELVDLRTGQAVTAERLRIARDVHDVVGHNLSLITMKAAVAGHLAAARPAEQVAAEQGAALRTIEQVGRAALADVRTVLGALRDSAVPPVTAGLDRLVEDARSAGVTVAVEHGGLTCVPAAVRVSAYRIVQEALANVRRHSDPPTCRVTAAVAPGRLEVSVVDGGAGGAVGPPGFGLLGMRERVALHGGELRTGVEPGGGFAVRATLPFDPEVRGG